MATQRVAKKTKAVRKPTKVVKKPALRAQQASRTPAARTAARAATIDDYEGARQVLSRYCHALDQGKLGEANGSTNIPDTIVFDSTTFATPRTITLTSRALLVSDDTTITGPGASLLTVNGTTATASTYFDADSVEQDGAVRVVTGLYNDILVKEQGQWFFKDRTISVFYRYSPGTCQEGM